MQNDKQETLSYYVSEHETEIPLVFAYSEVVEPRSVVAKVMWLPDDPENSSEINLSWSEALQSHFTYLPRATRPGIKEGPTLKVQGPGTIEIAFLTWPSRRVITDNRISGTYVRQNRSLPNIAFESLQRILKAGNI